MKESKQAIVAIEKNSPNTLLLITRIMVIMHQNVPPILVLPTLPHTQYTPASRLLPRRDKAPLFRARGSLMGIRNELELAPDGGAAAFPVSPGVFLVGRDGPVLFVLGVFVDCG